MSRGIHSKPVNGLSNDWMTPPEIIEALSPISLDPCAHPKQPWKTAETMVSPPDNGLKVKWRDYELTYVNPPFGQQLVKWSRKAVKEASLGANILLLTPARTEVEKWYFPHIWAKATSILFLKGRLYFRRPDGSREGNAGHGSCIAAYGELASDRLESSSIAGKFIRLRDALGEDLCTREGMDLK